MKEHYVSYEQSVALKRLGFDWKCLYHYSNRGMIFSNSKGNSDGWGVYVEELEYSYNKTNRELIDAPTLSQAAAWLRDCKGLHVSPDPYLVCDYDTGGSVYYERYLWSFELKKIPSGDYMKVADGGEFESYEQALSAGIDKALELLGKEVKE